MFALSHRHGDILREGWKNILDCLLTLFKAKLLPESLVEVSEGMLRYTLTFYIYHHERCKSLHVQSGIRAVANIIYCVTSTAPWIIIAIYRMALPFYIWLTLWEMFILDGAGLLFCLHRELLMPSQSSHDFFPPPRWKTTFTLMVRSPCSVRRHRPHEQIPPCSVHSTATGCLATTVARGEGEGARTSLLVRLKQGRQHSSV